MRELSDIERAFLRQLLVDQRFDRALVTLLHWARQSEGATGEEQERLVAWNLSHQQQPDATALTADDLEDGEKNWDSASCVHLIACLDTRLHTDWQTAGRPTVLVATADGTEYWLVRRFDAESTPRPRAASRRDRPDRETRAERVFGIDRFVRHFHLIPRTLERFLVELHAVDAELGRKLAAAAGTESGLIGYYDDGVAIDWDLSNAGYVLARALRDEAAHRAAALAHVAAAAGATFFVLPECTSPQDLRIDIAKAIGRMDERAPLMSVPGSWHDPEANGAPPFQNRCEVLDHRGSQLCRHVKTTSAHSDGGHAFEYIRMHNTLHAIATPIGLIGVCICLDFSHPAGDSHRAWAEIAPRWMLVPSMGDQSTVAMHVLVATQLWQTHRAISLVSNQRPDGKGASGVIVASVTVTDAVTNRVVPLSVLRKSSK